MENNDTTPTAVGPTPQQQPAPQLPQQRDNRNLIIVISVVGGVVIALLIALLITIGFNKDNEYYDDDDITEYVDSSADFDDVDDTPVEAAYEPKTVEYTGKVGSYPVHLSLNHDEKCHFTDGTMYYDRQGPSRRLRLETQWLDDSHVVVYEHDEKNNTTGMFDLKVTASGNGTTLRGSYTAHQSGKVYDFEASSR